MDGRLWDKESTRGLGISQGEEDDSTSTPDRRGSVNSNSTPGRRGSISLQTQTDHVIDTTNRDPLTGSLHFSEKMKLMQLLDRWEEPERKTARHKVSCD